MDADAVDSSYEQSETLNLANYVFTSSSHVLNSTRT